jgi:hypothetical protein
LFGGTLAKAMAGGNRKQVAGVTGWPAAKLRRNRLETGNSGDAQISRKPRKE